MIISVFHRGNCTLVLLYSHRVQRVLIHAGVNIKPALCQRQWFHEKQATHYLGSFNAQGEHTQVKSEDYLLCVQVI